MWKGYRQSTAVRDAARRFAVTAAGRWMFIKADYWVTRIATSVRFCSLPTIDVSSTT